MTKSDKELLQMAAKAAGYRVAWAAGDGGAMLLEVGCRVERSADDGAAMMLIEGAQRPWNPLEDDGDALRLAVAMNIGVKYLKNAPPESGLPRECAIATNDDGEWCAENMVNRFAAIRRAIVRSAANIGRGMK